MGKQKEKKIKAKRAGKSSADHRTLNQGQSPDFQTQDEEALKKNEALSEDEGEEKELPSKEREEIPYVGDNPDEIRRESPKAE
jgi:hypothetical protein